MFKNMGIKTIVLVGMLVIAVFVYAGVMFNTVVVDLNRETTSNRELVTRLRELAHDEGALDARLRLASFKASDVERALPSNLSQELILLDIYRVQHAVTDFNRASMEVSFVGERVAEPIQGGGELVKETINIRFATTYNSMKAFMLELENTPRTYIITNLETQKVGNQIEVSLVVEAYGMTSTEAEEPVSQAYEHNWFSPFFVGKNDLFNWQPQLSDVEINQRLFSRATPTSYVRDFVMHLNTKREDRPEVTFQRYGVFDSSLGGNVNTVTLNLTQINGKYYYSFSVGNERFPPTNEAEFHIHKGRDIVIEVLDDSALDDLLNLGQVTLVINNQTDREVRLVGDTNRRLRVVEAT